MIIMASGIARGREGLDGDDGLAQDGGHTSANRLTETCSHFFDTDHPCYGQLAPVKTRYLPTNC